MPKERAEPEEKKQRHRSPNHPILNLEDAVKHAQTLFGEYGSKHPISVGNIHKKLGYKEHGAVGDQIVAALKAYGLVDVHGQGKARKVHVTDRAERIVRSAPDRPQLIRPAALEPPIHSELLNEYATNGLPPDDELRTYLLWERDGARFNENVVDDFIKRLRETLDYAGIAGSHSRQDHSAGDTPKNGNDPEAPPQGVQVGSFVQWTSKGVDQFPEPRKVQGVNGEWAFVEGSNTGLPMSELSVVDPPKPVERAAPPVNPFYKPEEQIDQADTVTLMYKLDEGPVRLQWPDDLSPESVEEFEYWVNGLIKRAKRKAGVKPKKQGT